jgi:hypothetical protein
MCCIFILLVAFFFIADSLWFLLTPKEVRDRWERGDR